MSSSTIIPRIDSGKLALIQHIKAMLSAYADTLDSRLDDLAELNNATAWFKYSLDLQTALKAAAEAAVASKNAVRDGSPTGKALIPGLPNLLTSPLGEPFLDVFGYLAKLVTRDTEALGKALNITRHKASRWNCPPYRSTQNRCLFPGYFMIMEELP
ncbi:hypothetical protein [uncultured Thiodictyon sp.]|uniref:hypothetical protein n=1 Tax=uncultured Thiodictyon sp. TaxID=1846217 RepID=UPI0025E33AE7|nr:hypothetical protein [uncultured Thiodictyon sp.]